MFRASGPGLRSRLVALVLLGTLPAFAVLLHGALATRDAALENGRAGVELRARSVLVHPLTNARNLTAVPGRP